MRCLLLHGLAGSPFEVRPVAQALESAGFMTYAPALPGHGGTQERYLQSSFAQWREFARLQYARLSRDGPVLLAGYSLGGILALDAALWAVRGHLPAPAGILALATPLFFHKWRPFFTVDWRFCLLPLTSRLWPVLHLPPRAAVSRAIAPWQGHERVCSLRHFAEMERALPGIRAGLPELRVPLCVIQLRSDTSCHPYNAFYLAQHSGAVVAQLHLLRTRSPHGGHLPATHEESRQKVADLAVDFARGVAGYKSLQV